MEDGLDPHQAAPHGSGEVMESEGDQVRYVALKLSLLAYAAKLVARMHEHAMAQLEAALDGKELPASPPTRLVEVLEQYQQVMADYEGSGEE